MKNIEDANILVVGDIMLDKYTIGSVTRISPEAPVPIVNVNNAYEQIGGCGNVASNLKSLGANVTCMASVGDDVYGNKIIKMLDELGIHSFVRKSSKLTTVKERIVAGARQIQMLRLDYEYVDPLYADKILPSASKLKDGKFDYIVISDYAKGVISYQLVETLRMLNTPIIADPKPKNIHCYSNIFMLTPNKKEFDEIFHCLEFAQYTLVTLGRDGMRLYEQNDPEGYHIEGVPIDVYNVAGAGDVCVATVTAAMAMGFDPKEAAVIANTCANESVKHVGTCRVNKDLFNEICQSKISRTNI